MTQSNNQKSETNRKEPNPPLGEVTIDLSAPINPKPKYPDLEYMSLFVERIDEVVSCTVGVEEDPLPKLEELTAEELSALERCEGVIKSGLETFYRFALALDEIRRRKLFRGRFKSFAEYCLQVHGLGQSYAYRQAAVGAFVRENSPMGEKLPGTEREARKLIAEANAKKKAVRNPVLDPVTFDPVENPESEVREGDGEVEVVEPVAEVALPEPPPPGPMPLSVLRDMAENAYNIFSNPTKSKETESLLLKLKIELGRWVELQETETRVLEAA